MRRKQSSQVLFLAAACLVLLTGYALRVIDLHNTPPGIYYDEGRLLQRAWRISAGYGWPLYFQDIAEPFDMIVRAGYALLSGGVDLYMSQHFSVWLNVAAIAAVMGAARVLYRKHPKRDAITLVAGLALAVMPPSIIIGRHLYRANWLPVMLLLARMMLGWSWWRPHWRSFALAGIFTGLATIFYTGGLFALPAMLLVLAVAMLRRRLTWPGKKWNLLVFALGLLLVMTPWLYLYVNIPGWFQRVADLSAGASPLNDPSLLPEHIRLTLQTIFVPNTLHDMRYNTYTTAFLNPAFIGLLLIGIAASLWQWRRAWRLSPILILLVMVWPDILSSEPYQPIRLVGIFGSLALLVGFGAGELLRITRGRLVRGTLLLLLIASPFYSAYHIWYHYNAQPGITNPEVPESLAWTYRMGFVDLLEHVSDSPQPVYLPLEHLNTDLAVAVLRPQAFPQIRAYAGETLPDGRIILPPDSLSYGFFRQAHPYVQWGLLLPDVGEIVILPPLDVASATALQARIAADGTPVTNGQGWILGQALALNDAYHPLQAISIPMPEPIAVFDGNLELVGIDMPPEMVAGTQVPVTLYWRLREATGKDYFSRAQLWDAGNISHGREPRSPLINEPDFPLNIHYNIFPTVMWEAGEIVPDVRWMPLSENAPAAAYRTALAVYDYPGPTPVRYESLGAQGQDIWLLVGQSAVNKAQFVGQAAPQISADVRYGEHFQLVGQAITQNGAQLTVDLSWRVLEPTPQNYTVFVHLIDAEGEIASQADVQPFSGMYPTWAWQVADVVTLQFVLDVPAEVAQPYTLQSGMYSFPALQRLPITVDDVAQANDVYVISP